MEKNLDLFIQKIKEEEKGIMAKLRFCLEHKLKEEERILRIKLNIIAPIRFQAQMIKEAKNYEPEFCF